MRVIHTKIKNKNGICFMTNITFKVRVGLENDTTSNMFTVVILPYYYDIIMLLCDYCVIIVQLLCDYCVIIV